MGSKGHRSKRQVGSVSDFPGVRQASRLPPGGVELTSDFGSGDAEWQAAGRAGWRGLPLKNTKLFSTFWVTWAVCL